MIIIDSQVHVWAPETARRPYIEEDASKPHRPIPLDYEDLLGDARRSAAQEFVNEEVLRALDKQGFFKIVAEEIAVRPKDGENKD